MSTDTAITRRTAAALAGSLMLATTVLATSAAPAGAGEPCRVRNVSQNTSGASLRSMVATAQARDHLTVRGTCEGGVTIGMDLVIQGVGDLRPVLVGRDRHRVLRIEAGARVTIRHVVLADGRSARAGGAVLVLGTLTMDDAVVRDNVAETSGGGIHVAGGTLTLTRSVVRDNRALSYPDDGLTGGGGIGASRGSLTLIDTIVRDNVASDMGGGSGGGLFLEESTLGLVRSSVRANRALNGDGGGIWSWRGTLDLVDAVVRGNAAIYGGGILAESGALAMTGGAVRANQAGVNGGGLMLVDGSAALTGVTVRENQAGSWGGGILSDLALTLTDVDITGNGAVDAGGGGIVVSGRLTMTGSVVARNTAETGGGIVTQGTSVIGGSVIRENTAARKGGGLWNDGALTLRAATSVTGNAAGRAGGGLWNDDTPAGGVGTVIVRGGASVTGNTPDDCHGTTAC